jgi:membrane associated rhomboid family serine protease
MASVPSPVSVPSWLPLWQFLILAGVGISLAIVARLVGLDGRWRRLLTDRFVYGVPWGTAITCLALVALYLILQGGWWHPRNPLVLPFRAWSYLYPLGVLTASFTHSGLGHLTGNLVATLAYAPLVEYAWGHYPDESVADDSLLANPLVRILCFPAGVFLVGLLTSLFAVGPVVGFSGVVFAFAGFALVRYPVAAVVALAGRGVIDLLYRALRSPITEASGGGRTFTTPWWANIAIQGHALGLFLGVLAGWLYVTRRDRRPSPGRLWLAVLIFAVGQSLWALYWYRGGVSYVLFRGAGVVAVFLLATLVTAAVTAGDGVFLGSVSLPRADRSLTVNLRGREAAVGLLLALTIATAAAAIPVNLATVSGGPTGEGVQIRDYEVTYAEDVPDQYVSAVQISAFGETTQLNTSGVIVLSERRKVFRTAIPKQRLAFQGRGQVVVGGVGWRRSVTVNRLAWNPVGNASVYKVFLNPSTRDRRLVYTSESSVAEPRIDGRRVAIRPARQAFDLVVVRGNRTLGTTTLPTAGANVTAGGLTFNRTAGSIYAMRDETRVKVATEGGRRNG